MVLPLEEIEEISFNTINIWNKHIFLTLCIKYNIKTYRYKGDRKTIVTVQCTKHFMDNVFLPEYEKFTKILHESINVKLKEVIENILYEK
jgi:hypothetical protein